MPEPRPPVIDLSLLSPEQRQAHQKMMMLQGGFDDEGRPHKISPEVHQWEQSQQNAYQQYPIKSMNGAFTEGQAGQPSEAPKGFQWAYDNNQKQWALKALDQNIGGVTTGTGVGAGTGLVGTGADIAPTGGTGLGAGSSTDLIGTGTDIAPTGGTGTGLIGTGTGTSTEIAPTGGTGTGTEISTGTGTEISTGTGTALGTGTGIGITTGGGTTTGLGGYEGFTGTGSDIAPTGGTGTGITTGGGTTVGLGGYEGFTGTGTNIATTGGVGTGTPPPIGNWMNAMGSTTTDQSGQDYSQAASSSSMQNPFTNIYEDMKGPLDYFGGQGIDITDRYAKYFPAYDRSREEAAKQKFGFGQQAQMGGARTGLMGLTQQQGVGGFMNVGFGKAAPAREMRSQFGLQTQEAGLGLREDIYGMRKEQEEDWWTQLSRVEEARGQQFGITDTTETQPDRPPGVDWERWSPPSDPNTGEVYIGYDTFGNEITYVFNGSTWV